MPKFVDYRHIKVKLVEAHGAYNGTPEEHGVDLKANELVCNKKTGKIYHQGVHLLFFKVSGNTSLVFRSTPKDAFWAHELQAGNNNGPGTPSSVRDLVPLAVTRNGKLLVVLNLNRCGSQSDQRFGYTLRFIDSSGGEYDLDPVIRNGNGGDELLDFPSSLTDLALIGGAVAGAGALLAGAAYALSAGGDHRIKRRKRR
jgi:hypothetical protein